MPKLSPINPHKLIKILKKQGFEETRQKGSHVRLAHPDGRKTSLLVHSGESVGVGLLRKILRDTNISPQKFNEFR